MHGSMRGIAAAVIAAGLTVGCSDSIQSTAPIATAAFAKGGGGGGTAIPAQPTSATPTIVVSTSAGLLTALPIEQPVTVFVVATSEAGNRKAPTLTLVGAPSGTATTSIVSVDSPHGGGPGYVEATFTWTPTRDQIGLVPTFTFTASTSAASSTSATTLSAVVDAPSAINGLTATLVGDHIEARWSPVTGGVAPIHYVVSACYRNANIRPTASTCDVIATTGEPQLLTIPSANAVPSVAPAAGVANYIVVLVSAVDAAGHSSAIASTNVQ